MKEFKGKVAVVTGAASGIGRAMAERFAEDGMKVVLADVEQGALEKAEAEMRSEGAEVLAVRCDVSKAHDVRNLRDKTLEAFDSVHLLCNNAGVGISGNAWSIPLEDWEWVLGVNLWGVIHGIHYFVPLMLEHGQPSHIVNTASMAGLTSAGAMAPYYVSKHGVVTLSEGLHHEFKQAEANVSVSVLCPGFVDTRINEADRNRPSGPLDEGDLDEAAKMIRGFLNRKLKDGLPPRRVAELVMEAIAEEKFYVLPHADWTDLVRTRMEDVLEQRDPSLVAPPDA